MSAPRSPSLQPSAKKRKKELAHAQLSAHNIQIKKAVAFELLLQHLAGAFNAAVRGDADSAQHGFEQQCLAVQLLMQSAGLPAGSVAPRRGAAPAVLSERRLLEVCCTCGAEPADLRTCQGCGVARFCSACAAAAATRHGDPIGGVAGHQAHCAWLRRIRATSKTSSRHSLSRTAEPAERADATTADGTQSSVLHDTANLYLDLHAHVVSLLPTAWAARYRPRDTLHRATAEVLVAAHPDRLTVATAATCLGAVDDWDPAVVTMADRMFPAVTAARSEGARSRPTVHELIIEPLTHLFSFSVPNHEALDAIAAVGPIVEVGCGTGYWASLLRARGVDVLAFDLHPPTTAASDNGFHSAAWTEVLQGGPEVLLQDKSVDGVVGALAAGRPMTASDTGRALMLSWPSNNPTDCWDTDCLAAYRGDTVIYIGSFNIGALAMPEFRGTCSSPAFQRALTAGFELVVTVRIPTWPASADLVTIWTRKAGGGSC
jgi:hypothetical protein